MKTGFGSIIIVISCVYCSLHGYFHQVFFKVFAARKINLITAHAIMLKITSFLLYFDNLKLIYSQFSRKRSYGFTFFLNFDIAETTYVKSEIATS